MKYYRTAANRGPTWEFNSPTGNRIQFAPVYVSPAMQWAVPNHGHGLLAGSGSAPPYLFPAAFPAFGGYETPATIPPATPKK